MVPQPGYIDSLRTSGRFVGSLVALSIGLACGNIYIGDWAAALELIPGMIYFTALAWSALSTPIPDTGANRGTHLALRWQENPCQWDRIRSITWSRRRGCHLLRRRTCLCAIRGKRDGEITITIKKRH
jgi:hypothetical protein